MLAAYDSPERKFIRPGHKDAQAMWTSIYTNYTVLGYNSRLVSRDNVPKSHADLLKPIWRGQIGIVQTAYEWFAVMLQGMGQEKGLAFMRELAKQQPQLRNGRTLLAQLVAAGEVNSALAAYSQNFENLKRDGAPVDWVAARPGLRQSQSNESFGESAARQRGQSCSSILFCRKPGKKPFARNGACQIGSMFCLIRRNWLKDFPRFSPPIRFTRTLTAT